jgi:hypothetical protein
VRSSDLPIALAATRFHFLLLGRTPDATAEAEAETGANYDDQYDRSQLGYGDDGSIRRAPALLVLSRLEGRLLQSEGLGDLCLDGGSLGRPLGMAVDDELQAYFVYCEKGVIQVSQRRLKAVTLTRIAMHVDSSCAC